MQVEWLPDPKRYVLRAESAIEVRFLTALRDSMESVSWVEVSGSEPVPATASVIGLPPKPAATLGLVLFNPKVHDYMDPTKPYTGPAEPRRQRKPSLPLPKPNSVTETLHSLVERRGRGAQ